MSFMAHIATLVIALLAAIALVKARKTGFVIWAVLAGAEVGMISLIRLPDGLIVGLLLGLWAIGLGGQRLRTGCLVAFGLSMIGVVALNLGYNTLLTGNALAFPLDVYYNEYFGPKSNAMGFGPERGLGWPLDAFPGHSPLEAVLNAALNAFYLNIELFGWATGSLIFAAIALLSGRLIRSDYLMIAVIGIVIAVLSLYWFSGGPDFGARYWFLMIIPLVALTARGIQILEDKLWINTNRTVGTGLGILVVCLCAMTLFNFLPWRSIDKYFHYLGMRPDVRELASEYNFGKSIVLVRGSLYPDYQSAWVYNPITADQDGPIYAWDKSPEVRQQVQRAYQDRPVWIIDGPSLTNNGFQVIAGPLSGSSATNDTTP